MKAEKPERRAMVQETVLRIIGIWPSESKEFASMGRWIFAAITQIATIYSLSKELYRHCLDIDDTLDAFVMHFSSVVSLSKLLILRLRSRHTNSLINSVTRDWSSLDDARDERVMTEYFRKGRIVSLLILYLGYASGLSFVVKALPYRVLLPFQIYRGSASVGTNASEPVKMRYFLATSCAFGTLPLLQHVCVLVLQAVHIFVNAVAHCASDGLFFSLAMHLCGQFEVLKMRLAEIEPDVLPGSRRIGVLVERHCRLAVLVNDLEQSYSLIILVQLLMSTLLICVEGFVFLVCLNANDNAGASKSVVLVATLLIQLYLYAYAGDYLESRSAEIARAAYASLWYQSRGRAARELILVIGRGNSPCRITAGKFVFMNIYTFKDILKASASYLSVLKVMLDT